jgi:hypothetical protein
MMMPIIIGLPVMLILALLVVMAATSMRRGIARKVVVTLLVLLEAGLVALFTWGIIVTDRPPLKGKSMAEAERLFQQVQNGMTTGEVEALLGPPSHDQGHNRFQGGEWRGASGWQYSRGDLFIEIHFGKDGKVVSKYFGD